MDTFCPRKIERLTGKLESFRTNRSDNLFAKVRIGDTLFQLPVSARGTLQRDGTIRHCINGDRYDPIQPLTPIAVDLVYDANGTNPDPGLWAPTAKP